MLRTAMRALSALVLLAAIVAGCTPYIPVKDDFSTSAAAPAVGPQPAGSTRGDIPPEFAEFNVYDPGVNRLLAAQICATPYQPLEEKVLGASTGRLIQARGRCQTHMPLLGP
jgi:hypothetical protein